MSSIASSPFVLGFGSPLIDHLARVRPEQINEFGLIHGGMKLVGAAEVDALKDRAQADRAAPGGSAANTCIALAHLGGASAFGGVVGADEWGRFFSSELKRAGVVDHLIAHPAEATGRVLACVQPDGERSFATCLGAAIHLKAEDLQPAWFSGARFVYLEGYVIPNQGLVHRVVELARAAGAQVALDTASPNVVEEHRAAFLALLEDGVDVVFANAEEAFALTGKKGAEALDFFKKRQKTAVVKLGEEGSVAFHGTQAHRASIQKVKAIDTTGAGDYYAAGFLHGALQDLPLATCMGLGSIASRYVVQTWGAALSEETWAQVRQETAALLKKK